MALTLNCGCGTDGWGDVRLDISRVSNFIYDKPKSTANILGDVQRLPFRANIFNETRCWHTLEHVNSPKQALNELKRVTNGTINIRVPIWHFYSFVVEVFAFFKFILRVQPKKMMRQLRQIRNWKARYGQHKWYIKLAGNHVNKQFGIPDSYETIIRCAGN